MKRQRESRYITFTRLSYQLAETTLPRYSHAKSPHTFTLPQLATCVLLAFYLNLSYRDTEEWLLASSDIQQLLGLSRVPDHTTLYRTFRKLTVQQWEQMHHTLLKKMQVYETVVAVDTTSFRFENSSAYYRARSGKAYRDWLKSGYVVGCGSQFILGWKVGRGRANASDIHYLRTLRRKASPWCRPRQWFLIGDAGFDGKATRRSDLVPVIRRMRRDPTREDLVERMEQVQLAKLEGFYGNRWLVETVHSVIKRKMGDTIRSRGKRLQHREPILKALAYNIHR